MNKRIKELAGQVDKEFDNPGARYKAIERFAELIIQECLLALEPDSMAPAIDYDVEEKFYKRSANKIKKHFGHE